jgi:hypothetical protein
MNGGGQPGRCVVPANPLNKAAAAEAGEERERARGTRTAERAPDAVPGLACRVSWMVCGKWQ